MRELSPKKKKFMDFIDQYNAEHGFAPTFNEIMEALDIKSPGTVNWYVQELEQAGLLKRTRGFNKKRALEVVHQQVENTLPLLGQIAAGYPLEEFENREEIEVPTAWIHPQNYVLKVKGNSMTDDNIQDGDFVIIRKTATADAGDTVVAFVNNEATLKRYVPKNNHVELHPRNPKFNIIHVDPEDEFRIDGIVLYVFRKYSTRKL
ncbi:MAG: repressor LexA [Candidatus Marinimicrobia bacterium]|nr:repressor LexA [Candidatus Neomarinimicrobiota bacterium]